MKKLDSKRIELFIRTHDHHSIENLAFCRSLVRCAVTSNGKAEQDVPGYAEDLARASAGGVEAMQPQI
jgi:hypothetical protein